MGLWQPSFLQKQLNESIVSVCESYGGLTQNRFATLLNNAPTVSIAGDLHTRYRSYSQNSSSTTPFSVYLQDVKQHLQSQIRSIILDESHEDDNHRGFIDEKEEQGYLSMHLLMVPPKDSKPLHYQSGNNKKRKRQRHRPFSTQGGDPRMTLEQTLRDQGYDWKSMSEAESIKNFSNPVSAAAAPLECHVAVFRRPIFLYGYYTKSRRDVSQTPFLVVKKENDDQDSKRTVTLGVTSVEEQICGPIQALLGISTQNNPRNGNVQYAMCKFHASGREDMDVRMLLRPSTKGRPFCVQFVDAQRPILSKEQLQQLVHSINHTNQGVRKKDNDKYSSSLWYGNNPLGVGISNDFRLVPANAFSALQADTETKVKHYGCYCWSEKPLSENDDLTSSIFGNVQFPLTIQQKTPLRVLHRRANIIRERQILHATAKRVDAHYFRLELSTQAGTYVKEFVHGDLRRTYPSVASIMACKTNILELDCEGIDVEE